MTQDSFVINTSTDNGRKLVEEITGFNTSLLSSHSGSARPSYAVEGTQWLKNNVTPYVLYMYDGTQDVSMGTIEPSTGVFTPNLDSTVLPIAKGGTGQTTASLAFTALKQAATESATGVVELATTTEAAAGADTTRAVTPAGVKAHVDASIELIDVKTEQNSKNYLWAGEFQTWPMGHAYSVLSTGRFHAPAGATIARENFSVGVILYHVNGVYDQDAVRIQRTSGNTNTDPANIALNLTREETKPLVGKECVLQFHAVKGADFSGTGLTYKVQDSIEPEQAIISDDGSYTSGNEVIETDTVTLSETANAENEPFYVAFTVPEDAEQISVVFSVDWAGTAGDEDYVDIERATLHIGQERVYVVRDDFHTLMQKASTRYQASYGYGLPRGAATEQGAAQVIANATGSSWSFAMPIKFYPEMAIAPKFLFQSPTSGTESRLLNKDTATNIFGVAYNLAQDGVVITNAASVTAGNRCLCHWTANIAF